MNSIILWSEIENIVKNLTEKIQQQGCSYEAIYGIPRGGLITAVFLSHRLDLPLVMKLKPGCLVVDEIADTGKELSKEKYKNYDVCVLYRRYSCLVKPRYVGETINNDNWLIFPWEKK